MFLYIIFLYVVIINYICINYKEHDRRTNKTFCYDSTFRYYKIYKSNFDYLNDANFKYSIKSTSDCFYITFKTLKEFSHGMTLSMTLYHYSKL
jgi:hypothetical protein